MVVLFFLLCDVFFLKLPKEKLYHLFIGIAFTYVGLIVFLTAVNAGFMSIGAYVSAMFTRWIFQYVSIEGTSRYIFFIVALIIGGFVAGLVGLLIGVPSLRLKGDYLAIITLGFSEIIRVMWRVIPSAGRAKGIHSIPKIPNITFVYISVIVIMFVMRNITQSSFGRNCRSVLENELAADTLGINTTKTKVIAFVFSAFVAGVGGGLYAHLMTFINPETFNQIKSNDIVLYVYAGGVGSYTSSLLGAILFTFLPEVFRFLGEWRLVLYPLILIVVMIKRPKGLFGKHEFGFMRFGEIENIYQKVENAGVFSAAYTTIKNRILNKDSIELDKGKRRK